MIADTVSGRAHESRRHPRRQGPPDRGARAGDPGPGQVEVAIEAGGICGSDLHYFNHGGFGTVRLREPMILGHEVAGTISGARRRRRRPRRRRPRRRLSEPALQRLRLLPAKASRTSASNMRFYGSAMPMPHIQGAFRERLVAEAWQCHKVADGVSINEAALPSRSPSPCMPSRAPARCSASACSSPAAGRSARSRSSRRAPTARARSSRPTWPDAVLARRREIGADRTINVAAEPEALAAYGADKGSFDVQFEASGNERAVRAGLDVLRPRGVLVQLGLGGDVAIPQNLSSPRKSRSAAPSASTTSSRLAVDLINRARVDLKPLLTGIYRFEEAVKAFEFAGDRSRSMKVQLRF